mgnify:CR=1 FL=1
MESNIEVKPQGFKRFAKGPLKLALVAINKLSNPTYKKLYPRYLRWLGINLSKDFSSYGDPWISQSADLTQLAIISSLSRRSHHLLWNIDSCA